MGKSTMIPTPTSASTSTPPPARPRASHNRSHYQTRAILKLRLDRSLDPNRSPHHPSPAVVKVANQRTLTAAISLSRLHPVTTSN